MAGAVVLLSKFGRAVQAFFDESDNLDLSTMSTGNYVTIAGKRVYVFTTAITENSTTTSAPVGSLGLTTNATGRTKLFYSDATKWQLAVSAAVGGTGTQGVAVADPAALTSATLTDNSGGSANATVQAIGATFDQAEVANNFADVVAQINALRVDLAAVRTVQINLITSLEGAALIAT